MGGFSRHLGRRERVAHAVLTGPYASLPPAAVAGDEYMPTDAPFKLVWTGSAWQPFWLAPLYPMTLIDPTTFTWINQGASTAVTTNGSVFMQTPVGVGGTNNRRMLVKSAPATPYTITLMLQPQNIFENNHMTGIVMRDSGTGKLVIFEIYTTSGGIFHLQLTYFTNPTTFSSTPYDANPPAGAWSAAFSSNPLWLRLNDNGTNFICSWALDGRNFSPATTQSRTAFLATPNQYGFGLDAEAAHTAQAWFHSLVIS